MAINLHEELIDIRRMILGQGATVEQRLNCILQAVEELDFESAQLVRHGDRPIDEQELAIEQACLRVLALSQPVATDLRFVLSVLRINGDLERIADLSKSIAKRLLHLQKSTAIDFPDAIPKMASYARHMVGDVLSALADGDTELSQAVRRADQHMDDLQREVFAWAHREIPRHVEATKSAIDVLSIARALERIGDLATNIAEDVIFLVSGTVVRHSKAVGTKD